MGWLPSQRAYSRIFSRASPARPDIGMSSSIKVKDPAGGRVTRRNEGAASRKLPLVLTKMNCAASSPAAGTESVSMRGLIALTSSVRSPEPLPDGTSTAM